MSHRLFTGLGRIHPLISHPFKGNMRIRDFGLDSFNVNNLNLETQSEGDLMLKDPRLLLNHLAGSLITFLVSISGITLILIPRLLKSLHLTHSTASEATIILAGILSAALLLILSFSWLIRSLMGYFTARQLDLASIRVTGSIMDKWVQETDDGLTYYVRYSYLNHLNTRQTVNKHTFQQLENGDSVTIVYQADRPVVSRLDID